MKKLIILRGISGSGKSTEAKRIIAEAIAADPSIKTVVCSADYYFMQGDEYKFDPTKLGAAHGQCKRAARDAMSSGVDLVLIDNTNTQRKEYQVYLDIAEQYGYKEEERIVGKFDKESIELYASRNRHGVPLASIKKMAARFEYTCEICGKTDETVELSADPYEQDMFGKIVEMYLCGACYRNRVQDI